MLLPSLSLSPAAPVLDTRSLPARSTRLILLTFSPEFYLAQITGQITQQTPRKTYCENNLKADPRLEVIKRLCDDDAEDGVRAAALLVHVGGCDCARFVPL